MRFKSIVGFCAILVALWVFSISNRDNFHQDLYTVCIGMAGEGPVVTDVEKATCACMADAAVASLPWKSRLPQSMIRLTAEDNARMIEAQKSCDAAKPVQLSGTASPARTGDLWIHNPAL